MAAVAAIVDTLKWFSNSESPCRPNASHHGGHLGCWNGTAIMDTLKWFSNSESQCLPNASHQVSAQSNLPFGSRGRFKISMVDVATEPI